MIRALILRAAGTNCEEETAYGWQLAGATPRLVHIRRLLAEPHILQDVQTLTIPGGFSYGDDVAAGRIWANQLRDGLAENLQRFVEQGKLILGICNGFQVLVKAGLLPGPPLNDSSVTVTWNDSSHYEDRWTRLEVGCDHCKFLRRGTTLELPVGHAEGKVIVRDDGALRSLQKNRRVALRYMDADDAVASYPANPNGSVDGIAGLTDATGQVLGLMPHPDRFLDRTNHPLWTRRTEERTPDGLELFRTGLASLR